MADYPDTTELAAGDLATIPDVFTLDGLALLGVFGTEDAMRALVRHANGRIRKVAVGDRLAGGRVVAVLDHLIVANRLGETRTLRMPTPRRT